MGTWNINIKGHGCHHNGNPEIDADLATKEFVKKLAAQGHGISRAEFELTGSSLENLLPGGVPIRENDPAYGKGQPSDSDFGKRWKAGLGQGLDLSFFEVFEQMWEDGRRHPIT